MNFIDKIVSIKQATTILVHNGVQIDDDEANIILDFFYLMSKNQKETEEDKTASTLRGNRTSEEML